MAFVAAKCTNCGGELQLDDNLKTGYCMFCGSRVVIQEAIDLKKVQIEGKVSVEGLATVENLLMRGNQSMEAGEYKKAEDFFEQVINIDAKNHAAWWGKFSAQFLKLMNMPKAQYDGYSINNELHRTNKNDNLSRVGLVPYIGGECFLCGKRAIEYSDAEHKDHYKQEYDVNCTKYQVLKKWSERTRENYVADCNERDRYKKSSSIGCGFSILIFFVCFVGSLLLVYPGISRSIGTVFLVIGIPLVIILPIFSKTNKHKTTNMESEIKRKYFNI